MKQKFTELLSEFNGECKIAADKFVESVVHRCKNPKQTLLALLWISIAIAFVYCFVNYALPCIFVIGLFAYVFYENNQKENCTFRNLDVCWEVQYFMFSVLGNLREVLGEFCVNPKSMNDIYDNGNFRIFKSNAVVLKLRLLLKKEVTEDDCGFLKVALQSAVNARILDGNLTGCVWAVAMVNDVPFIKILKVEQAGTFLHIFIALNNEVNSVNLSRLADNPAPKAYADDKDPLF